MLRAGYALTHALGVLDERDHAIALIDGGEDVTLLDLPSPHFASKHELVLAISPSPPINPKHCRLMIFSREMLGGKMRRVQCTEDFEVPTEAHRQQSSGTRRDSRHASGRHCAEGQWSPHHGKHDLLGLGGRREARLVRDIRQRQRQVRLGTQHTRL